MTTRIDDDYLICKHYYNHIDDVSSEYKDFITYEHNKNHYFAWVNKGKVIMRSEAYPSHDKMVRGIKAIIKNRDIVGRYSIESKHGANFLLMWGGGDHQKHTGNFAKHNEIGRSCPTKTKEELYDLLLFKGKSFADEVFGRKIAGVAKGAAAAATATAFAAKTDTTSKKTAVASTGGGFKWWWLLPLLLIPLFFVWKGCGNDAATVVKTPVKKEAIAPTTKVTNDAELARVKALKAKEEAAAVKAASDRRAAEKKIAEQKASKKKAYSKSISTYGNKSTGF